MNKKLIVAVLGLAFAGVAQAQSQNGVVLYGLVDGGLLGNARLLVLHVEVGTAADRQQQDRQDAYPQAATPLDRRCRHRWRAR